MATLYINFIYTHIHVHVLFQGGTPLHYYVWVDNRKKEKTDFLVSLLTEGEVDVNSKTEEGNTALHLAAKVSIHSTRLTSKKAKCIEQQSPALVDSAVLHVHVHVYNYGLCYFKNVTMI